MESYIFASYPKWIEASGMRWVPLFIQETEDQFHTKLGLVDAVLLTGGSEKVNELYISIQNGSFKSVKESLYMQKVRQVLAYSKKQFHDKKIFPVWGTCLGLESMLVSFFNYSIKLESDLGDLKVSQAHPHIIIPAKPFP